MSTSPYWSPDEDALLRQHYPTASLTELVTLFPHRPVNGVRQRAWKLGLRKDRAAIEYGPVPTTMIGHLSETETAYLAGIIDGEGCITLQRRQPKAARRPVYAPYVSIATTSPALLAWLDERFPGKAYVHRHTIRKARCREWYQWILAGNRQIIIFLQEIAPYLIIKREQAELIMHGYLHLAEEDRYALFLRLRDLKRTA